MDQIKTGKRSLLAPIALLIAAALTASIGLMGLTPDTAYAASKTKIWVVTKAKVVVPKSMQSDSNWSSTNTYSYNKSGLVTSIKDSAKSYYAGTNKYEYDKKDRLVSGSFKNNKGDMSFSEKYVLSKKGCVKKTNGSKITYKYNSKNQVVKYTSGYDKSTEKYLYDAQNRLSRVKSPQGWITDTAFIYDASNQLVEIQTVADGTADSVKLTNTYKNGRLVKQVARTSDGTKIQTVSYTYKKISVPKSLANRVKSQQNWVFLQYAAYGAGVSYPNFYNINTNFGVTKAVKATQPTVETASATKSSLKAASV